METPKPHPPKTVEPNVQNAIDAGKAEKRAFVNGPRMTHRPFADNQAFKKLGSKKIDPKAKRQR